MTYVVTEVCIKCKYMDCVEVCPVDCFYEGENMLVIHPDECIDCGVCEPECPVDAIKPDTEPGLDQWLEINANIREDLAEHHDQEARPPPDAEEFEGSRTSSRNISAQPRGGGLAPGRVLNIHLTVKMSHVAVQNGRCRGTA